MKKFMIILTALIAMTITVNAQWQSQNEKIDGRNTKDFEKHRPRTITTEQHNVVITGKHNFIEPKLIVWKLDSITSYDTNGLPVNRFTRTFDIYGNIITEKKEQWQTNTWVNSYRQSYAYDGSGNMLTYLYEKWQADTWVNNLRDTRTYDGSGNMLTFLREKWETNTWVNSLRTSSTYDESGNQLTQLQEKWITNSWEFSNRFTKTYDGSGNMLTYLQENWETTAWINGYRFNWSYDGSGNILTYLYEKWETNTWVIRYRSRNTYTYDESENMLMSIEEVWKENTWVNNYRDTYTYDLSGNMLTNISEWWQIDTWEYSSRYTWTYDENGNVQTLMQESWNSNTLTWMKGNIKTYTYDNNGNSITGKFDEWENSGWQPGIVAGISLSVYSQKKSIYSLDYDIIHRYEAGFISFDNAGVEDFTGGSNLLSIYPNPASETVTLNIKSRNNLTVRLNIYTVAGKLVKSEILRQNQKQINVSDIGNGIYVVEIKSKVLNCKQKLIIQR